jgi:hypothetical protein
VKGAASVNVNKLTNMELICINDNFSPEAAQWFTTLPKEGERYTLRKLVPVMSGVNSGKMGVLLHEIINPLVAHPTGLGMIEPSFDENRFVSPEEYDQMNEEINSALVEELEEMFI